MSSRHPILLIDDGELVIVRRLLDELDADFAHLPAATAKRPVPLPSELLVTSARAAVALMCRRTPSAQAPRPVWIAFSEGAGSAEESDILQQSGFDFVVRNPVHPSALRLLLRRALYQGIENRLATRVAVGEPVRFATGLWPRSAVLADLSPRGCRLLCACKPPIGSVVKLRIPSRSGGRSLRLRGVVLRTLGAREGGHEREVEVGLRFLPLSSRRRERLRELLRERVSGPAVLPEPLPEAAPAAASSPRSPRLSYERSVAALCADATHVLLGRDLSAGGIRVEQTDALAVGDRTQLGLHGAAREEPLLVNARVLRDDGEDGMALQFEHVDGETRARIDALLESLPPFESLQDDGASIVLAQLVKRRAGS